MKHVPNALTLSRIILAPLFLFLLFSGGFQMHLAALAVFVVAAVSDWLDGRLARRYKARSRLGTFLDPLADKILVLGAFIALPFVLPDLVPWWAVVVIAVRDVLITGLRIWSERKGETLRTVQLAKTKTGMQLTFIIVVLVLLTLEHLSVWEPVGRMAGLLLHGPVMQVFLYAVVLLTAYTGITYFLRREVAPN